MNYIKIFLWLILVLLSTGKMVYLSELFRHGARYPISDMYDGKEMKHLHGILTGIGMRQHFLLGTYLRKDYLNELRLNPHFDQK